MIASSQQALLATVLQLEQRSRKAADPQELAFLVVNETHAVVPYRQAVLWQHAAQDGPASGGRILALSGLAVPDPHAPFNVWLTQLLEKQRPGAGAALYPAPEDALMWQQYLPPHAWYLPLLLEPASSQGRAGLLLLRDEAFHSAEIAALDLLGDAYAHAWRALSPSHAGAATGTLWQRLRQRSRERRYWLAGLGVAVLALCFPVHQTVLAPAEIVARNPLAVRSPAQAVVDHIAVQPNTSVKAGQLLVALDARELEGRVEAARQALAVADAELRQGQQQALFDERSKANLAIIQGRRDQAGTDMDYLVKALERTQLRAESDGIAIFDDAADWVGRPVSLGERIMLVTDPEDTEIEVQLPVADAIELPAASQVQLFLNTAPASPIAASLLRVGYRAGAMPDGTLAYRVKARFTGTQTARVGLKGTAKLYGRRTILAAYLLRRPLATLRVWLGI